MIIYVGKDYKCHAANADGLTAVETEFFDGKCDAFIEGYCYEVRENGAAIYPWKPYAALDSAQREYEKQLIAEMQANSIPTAELEAAYQEGVNSAYD